MPREQRSALPLVRLARLAVVVAQQKRLAPDLPRVHLCECADVRPDGETHGTRVGRGARLCEQLSEQLLPRRRKEAGETVFDGALALREQEAHQPLEYCERHVSNLRLDARHTANDADVHFGRWSELPTCTYVLGNLTHSSKQYLEASTTVLCLTLVI